MADLDESIVKDFAEKILRVLSEKPERKRFGMTHLIELVRDCPLIKRGISWKDYKDLLKSGKEISEELKIEFETYKRVGDHVPEYVHSATSLLVEQKKIQEHKGSGEKGWDNKYSLI